MDLRQKKNLIKLLKNLMLLEDVLMKDLTVKKLQLKKLKHFISKDAINIDGLGKKVVEKFWDLKFIKLPQDIYNLDYQKISTLMDGDHNQYQILNIQLKIRKKLI